MVDGCFLRCIGRLMNNLVNREAIVHIDALTLHKKYSTVFHMDEVAESERKETARLTADRILALLKNDAVPASGKASACRCAASPGAE